MVLVRTEEDADAGLKQNARLRAQTKKWRENIKLGTHVLAKYMESAEEKHEALRMLEDVAGVMRRVMGPAHPDTLHAQRKLEGYRQRIE